MTRKAIAYTSDIILGRTGETIKRSAQQELIRQHAAENDIEIVAWFEDDTYDEEVMRRPGVQRMLAHEGKYDVLLVERVWCFSRSWKKLWELIDALRKKNVELEATSWLFDCVSVLARHHNHKEVRGCLTRTVEEPAAKPASADLKEVRIRRPARLNFGDT